MLWLSYTLPVNDCEDLIPFVSHQTAPHKQSKASIPHDWCFLTCWFWAACCPPFTLLSHYPISSRDGIEPCSLNYTVHDSVHWYVPCSQIWHKSGHSVEDLRGIWSVWTHQDFEFTLASTRLITTCLIFCVVNAFFGWMHSRTTARRDGDKLY